MLIYSPETEGTCDYIVNSIHSDSIKRIENEIMIYTVGSKDPAITIEYKTKKRAKKVFSDLMRAITDGKNLFIMPTE